MKIGWILSSSRNAAGSRIHGWNMHDCFLKKGIDSNIVYSSLKYGSGLDLSEKEIQKITDKNYDVLVLVGFKNKGSILKLIKLFQKKGYELFILRLMKFR